MDDPAQLSGTADGDGGRLSNLPTELDSFVGRARELSTVHALVDQHRLVSLTGAGGSGKTRLALRVASDRIGRHAGGVWFVELAALADGRAAADALAVALDVGASAEQPVEDAVAARLGTPPALVVLDNCEHVIEGVAVLVARLLRACPGLRIVTTTRQPLDVRGEVMWRVPSMSLPATPELGEVGSSDAVQLFVERARRGRPDFELDRGNVAAVVDICRRLDGMPLAIELAASRVRQMGVADIERGLEHRFGILTGTDRFAVPRQQTLAASIDWSHDLLGPEEQVVLRRLAVFRGPFTVDAAVSVLDEPDGTSALVAMGGLVDQSLLQLDDRSEGTRYRLLETIRAYSLGRLEQAGELPEVAARHVRYHVELVEEAEPLIRADLDPVWLAHLDGSHDDLHAALRWACDSGDLVSLARLVAALGAYWHTRGMSAGVQSWYEQALRPEADPALRGRAAWASAYLALYANDLALASSRAELARELAASTGDRGTEGRAYDTLGTVRQFGDPAGAEPMFVRAVELARASGDTWCEVDALQKLSFSSVYRDRWDEALAAGRLVDDLAGQLGNPFFRAWGRFLHGEHALRIGDVEAGIEALHEGVELADDVGEPMTIGCVGTMLALLHLLAGDGRSAEGAIESTRNRLAEGEAGLGDAMVDTVSGVIALHQGDAARAVELIAPVHRHLLGLGVAFPTSFFGSHLALAHADADDAVAARAVLEELTAIDRVLASSHLPSAVELALAVLDRRDGRPDMADPHARAALDGFVHGGFWPDAATALEVLGGVMADLGNRLEGARLLSAAAASRREHGWRSRWSDRLDHDVAADVAACRSALGPGFDAAWADGARLDLRGASTLASRARGRRQRPATGWASLTPTELEVVEHVAAGRTNPEIGHLLLMSRATVKTHVSHVLAKLGLRTRAEIAAEVSHRRAVG